ncbi:MAG: alpha-glycosidase, partial [Acetatifactor sp.]|nr:alpha-glycosidase [Acetatifactor sp.]
KSEGAYNNPDSEERKYYFFEPGSNKYVAWAGVKDLPTLNYTSEELRKTIYRGQESVLKKWLKPPYNIDGWRFDVADVFARNDEVQLAHELWPEIRKSIREENEQAYILAEDWGDCAPYLQGKEWDSPMNYFGFARVIRQFLGEPDLFMVRNDKLKNVPYRMTAEDVKARITEHLSKLPYVIAQNQFNLFDSHDVSRLHNNPKVNKDEYRGAVMMLFTLIGTSSIYYGDEAEVDGEIKTNEGCRYPMPWNKEYLESDTYKLYQTLAHLKTEGKALSDGGMKFLYAGNQVISIARFYEDEIYITVMSTADEDQKIRLPIGSVGVAKLKSDCDVFGSKLEYHVLDEHSIELTVKAHQSYFIDCSK